ncbi:hypothetical protein BDY19DRAFT_974119 [Irpex rosettiformis]|uniref:Uncharacterized protein n=1 Tax=Irpex rosettiformis TaxID=378272 RepID=A0ACB8TPQ9_9APHY|nr:hypothetical protein BDY19DRAFT_974119 [Irpex rosettiformis]
MLGSRMSWAPERPVVAMYASSKTAVRVIGETLAIEVAPFGIRTLILEPAGFRTEGILAGKIYDGNKIADYDPARKYMQETKPYLPNDPVKAMNILADVVRGEGKAKGKPWPLYLPLAMEAEDAIRSKTKSLENVLDDWGDIIRDTKLDNP